MFGTIRKLHEDIDTQLILQEINFLLENYSDAPQVSLYSITGNNDWESGIGSPRGKPYVYSKINKSLKDTYTERVLSRYEGYYRWRILRLKPSQNYTIHADRGDNRNLQNHFRIHIPLITNPRALVLFFKDSPYESSKGIARWHHLDPGNSYLFNAGMLHTALHGGHEDRIHLVGQKSK